MVWVIAPQWSQTVLPVQFLVLLVVLIHSGVPVSWAGVLVPLEAEFGEVRGLVSVDVVRRWVDRRRRLEWRLLSEDIWKILELHVGAYFVTIFGDAVVNNLIAVCLKS